MEKIVELRGEIINNNILKLIDETIKEYDAKYRIIEINVEETEQDLPYIKLAVDVHEDKLEELMKVLLKVTKVEPFVQEEAILKPSLKDATIQPLTIRQKFLSMVTGCLLRISEWTLCWSCVTVSSIQ